MDEQTPTAAGRLRDAGIWLLAAAPLLLALFGTKAFPAQTPLSGNRPQTGLAFSQYAVNLGLLPSVGSIDAHFDFWNQSLQPVKILKIVPSCGCLAPRMSNDLQVYQPGQRGSFRVSVRQANEAPGSKNYAIRVLYEEGGEEREQRLAFRCAIPERKVTVSPSELLFYQQGSEPLRREIRVDDHRGRNMRVTEVMLSTNLHGLVTASVGERTVQGGLPSTPIQVEAPGHAPPGRVMGRLLIRTDDPDFSEIAVPIWVFGPAAAVQLTSGIVPLPDGAPPHAAPSSKTSESDAASPIAEDKLPEIRQGRRTPLPQR